MGRIDHQNENTLEELRMMHDQLPTEFMSTPQIIDYWVTTLTMNQTPPPGWDNRAWNFAARDIVGLLGAHTLLDNHGCMEQECGGEKKMFVWNQDWYKVRHAASARSKLSLSALPAVSHAVACICRSCSLSPSALSPSAPSHYLPHCLLHITQWLSAMAVRVFAAKHTSRHVHAGRYARVYSPAAVLCSQFACSDRLLQGLHCQSQLTPTVDTCDHGVVAREADHS